MNTSSSNFVENDKALEGLYDAFTPAFSCHEIQSAYNNAGHDANLACELLAGLKICDSGVGSSPYERDCDGLKFKQPYVEDNFDRTTHKGMNDKVAKPKKVSVSIGSVSSVLGRRYVKRASPSNDSRGTARLLPKDELCVDMTLPNPAPETLPVKNNDIETFLFEMLGDGFQLGIDVIRDVLGTCGYDAKKCMEKLLNRSDALPLALSGSHSNDCQDSQSSGGSILGNDLSQSEGAVHTSGAKVPCADDRNHRLSKEVLETLFNVPDRHQEAPKRLLPRTVRRPKTIGTVVTAPPSIDVDPLPAILEPEDIEDVRDDNYLMLQRLVKENWNAMKACFEAAFDAHSKGDRESFKYLLDEGNKYLKEAREADVKLAKEIVKPRNVDVQKVFPLDLREHDLKDAIHFLKLHLRKLASIPSIQFLKLILLTEADGVKKGAHKRLVMKFLEKKNIKWVEEENTGNLLIRMDKIDPDKLIFAKKPTTS